MTVPAPSGTFPRAFARELRLLPGRPALVAMLTVMPLVLFLLLAGVFRAGIPTGLALTVIDQDGSAFSRTIVRMLDETPEISVTHPAADLAEAKAMIRSGEARGAVLIPSGFARDLTRGERPEVVLFYDNQHMSAGSILSRGARNAIETAAAGVRLQIRTGHGEAPVEARAALQPIPVQASGLFNPGLDYVDFLLAALFPAVLQIAVAAAMAYAASLDFARARPVTDGVPLMAPLMGRLLPYTMIFLLVLGLSDVLLYGYMAVPLRGSLPLMALGAVLFILAAQLLGVLAWLMTQNMGRAVSLVALITAPAFGYMGLGFPREGMAWPAQVWSAFLPGTWYVELRIDQSLRATPAHLSVNSVLALLAIVVVLGLAVLARLRHLPMPEPDPTPEMPATDPARPMRSAFRREWAGMLRDKQVAMILIMALGLYGLIYPYPYTSETLREVPVVLVDQDNSELSRELARRVEATQALWLTARVPDMIAAKDLVQRREAMGVLLIPEGFQRNLKRGRQSPVAVYADASYFLYYQQVMRGVSAPARALGAEVEAARLIGAGTAPQVARAQVAPISYVDTPLFNPAGGYATYVLPAAFVMILQQTLLMGLALVAVRRPPMPGPLASLFAGRALAWLGLYAMLVPLYLIVLPWAYGLPRLGSVGTVFAIALPFVLAAGCLAQMVARLFRRSELVQLVLLGVGMPVFFISGFAWPVEAIPAPLALLSQALPSTPAIDAFVRATAMGATLPDLSAQLGVLWAQVLVYGAVWALLARAPKAPLPADKAAHPMLLDG